MEKEKEAKNTKTSKETMILNVGLPLKKKPVVWSVVLNTVVILKITIATNKI